MKVYKCVIIGFCFMSITLAANSQTPDSLLNQLSRKWMNAKTHTLQLAELMPEDSFNFKPSPEVMSFREQLLHLAENMLWLSSSYILGKKDFDKPDIDQMDKAAVLNYVSSAYDYAFQAHLTMEEKQMNEVVPFFAGPLSRRQILILMHDHQTHHVGQLIVYLRLKGIKPVNYVGW